MTHISVKCCINGFVLSANLASAVLDRCQMSVGLKRKMICGTRKWNATTQNLWECVCVRAYMTYISHLNMQTEGNWKEIITHHTPGRTQRVDRRRTEVEPHCKRPGLPGG